MVPASIVFPDPLFLFQTPDENDEQRFHCTYNMRFVVLAAVNIKIMGFWDVTPSSWHGFFHNTGTFILNCMASPEDYSHPH
jgi:hypothetical protein